ncbi:MAG: RNA 2'-phosphotransferase [Chitinophagaceae bacterium]
MDKELKRISKFMSLVLRHQPELIGLTLTPDGWAPVAELIAGMNEKGIAADRGMIQIVVDTNDKKRFAFNEDRTMIRASQGHSIAVELGLEEQTPPDILYHGTAAQFIESIRGQGLQKQQRHHVHLSAAADTARTVGSRHGKPVVLIINAKAMHAKGHKFYQSENGVWLTEEVPAAFFE